jgi:hypothetical protein
VTPAAAQDAMLTIRVDGGAEVAAPIVPLPFYDPAGARQKVDAGGVRP